MTISSNRVLLSILFSLAAIAPRVAEADDSPTTHPLAHVNHPGLVKLSWQLACRGSTFHDRTTFEMIDLLHSLGFHHIELSTEQILSPDRPDVKIGPEMDSRDIDALLAKLKSVHMDIVSFGILDPGNDETAARKAFDFGSRFKIKTLVVDPTDDSIEMLAKLADEYRINVAIENSAKPGKHWDVDALVSVVAGRSDRLGVCADPANWQRSGLVPLECIRKLKGRIVEIHLADVNDLGQEVPLGSGNMDAPGILAELKSQRFKGICAIEYGTGTGQELVDRFTDSVNAFSDMIGDLSGTR